MRSELFTYALGSFSNEAVHFFQIKGEPTLVKKQAGINESFEMKNLFDNKKHMEEANRSHRLSVEDRGIRRHKGNLPESVLRGKQTIKYHGIDLMTLVSTLLLF